MWLSILILLSLMILCFWSLYLVIELKLLKLIFDEVYFFRLNGLSVWSCLFIDVLQKSIFGVHAINSRVYPFPQASVLSLFEIGLRSKSGLDKVIILASRA